MVFSKPFYTSVMPSVVTTLFALSGATALTLLRTASVQAQTVTPALAPAELSSVMSVDAQNAQLAQAPAENQELRPLSQDGNLLSVSGGQRLMQEAGAAVSSQNYDLAIQRLQQARQVFNQLSGFYQELAASFSGIDTRISDSQRQQAASTAQLRDEATYQLALVHRAQNKPELAVPLLVQIIRSQNPTRDLGQRAYQQLFELGFVDSPYPRAGQPTSSTTP